MKSIKRILTLLISIATITSCSYSAKKALKIYEVESSKVYDVIIVPGVPFENEQWSRTMRARVLWGKYLYDKGIAERVMYSGSSVYTPYVEAKVMAQYGKALGIKEKDIFEEVHAEHSTENLYYGYQYAKKLGYEKIALASDPFQTKLLAGFAKKIDPQIGLIPMVFDSLLNYSENIGDPNIDHESLIVDDFVSIKEREGFWKRLKGTRGKSLKEGLYD